MLDTLEYIVISFFIGLLLGIERERAHVKNNKAIGVRTFILIALIGTLSSILKQPVIIVTATIFIFCMIMLSYIQTTRQNKSDTGITTEISSGITFILGYMIPLAPLTAITISAIVLLVLIERERLHKLSHKKLIPQEIEAIILIVILGVGILPALPDRTIDAWEFFNPKKFVFLIFIILCMQFVGYVAIQLIGERIGRALLGFFGGLVSSTAVTASIAEQSNKNEKLLWIHIATTILSITATLFEVIIILTLAAPSLSNAIKWPVALMTITSSLAALYLISKQKISRSGLSISTISPVDLKSLARTTIIISIIFIIVAATKKYLSTTGVLATAFLGGLCELHGVTLATALLYSQNQLPLATASIAILTAILASFISKYFLIWTLGTKRFAFYTTIYITIICIIGGLATVISTSSYAANNTPQKMQGFLTW